MKNDTLCDRNDRRHDIISYYSRPLKKLIKYIFNTHYIIFIKFYINIRLSIKWVFRKMAEIFSALDSI